jgi:hypothetical protein
MLPSLWEKTAARTGAFNAASSALTNNFLVNAQSVRLWRSFARLGFFLYAIIMRHRRVRYLKEIHVSERHLLGGDYRRRRCDRDFVLDFRFAY